MLATQPNLSRHAGIFSMNNVKRYHSILPHKQTIIFSEKY